MEGVSEGNPSSIRSYFWEVDCDTHPDLFRRHLSFDSGYVFRDQHLFHKKTPKVRLYPSLTFTLSSILRQVDRRGFELIRREKDPFASGVFSRNASACEALRERIFGSER